MIVYFCASVTGRKKFDQFYRSIVKSLEANKCKVLSKHVFTSTRESLLAQTLEERIRDHNKLQKLMKKADVVVAEVSHPSTSIGYELARALEWEKPVLVLHSDETDSPTILRGRISDKLILQSYNLRNLEEVIKGGLDFFKRAADERFTLVLPARLVKYLDWIVIHKKIPRSVFIREILSDKQEMDQQYFDTNLEKV